MPRPLLLFGTNTGNTLFAAQTIAGSWTRAGTEIEAANVGYASADILAHRPLVILGAPTWNRVVDGRLKEGQLQDQMDDFLRGLPPGTLEKVPIAVFGLGDSRFQHFCGAAVVLQKFVATAGASLVAEPLYLDGYPQQHVSALQDWATHVRRCWQDRQVLAEG